MKQYDKTSGYFIDHLQIEGTKFHDFINGVGLSEDESDNSYMNDISNWSMVAGHWQNIYVCYIFMVVFSTIKIVVFGFFGTDFFSRIFKFFHDAAIITAEVIKT